MLQRNILLKKNVFIYKIFLGVNLYEVYGEKLFSKCVLIKNRFIFLFIKYFKSPLHIRHVTTFWISLGLFIQILQIL